MCDNSCTSCCGVTSALILAGGFFGAYKLSQANYPVLATITAVTAGVFGTMAGCCTCCGCCCEGIAAMPEAGHGPFAGAPQAAAQIFGFNNQQNAQ